MSEAVNEGRHQAFVDAVRLARSGTTAIVVWLPARRAPHPMARPADRLLVTLVLLAALLVGGYWLAVMPPWQHNDEPTHFEYAWLLANEGRAEYYGPGTRDMPMQRELLASMVAADFYVGLTAPSIITNEADNPYYFGYDETVHPPLYFRLVALPLAALRHLDVTSQLYVARGVSLLLFLVIVGAALGALRELTPPRHPLRWAAPLALVVWAPFANHMTSVNNDVGAVAAMTLFLWGVARTLRRGPSVLNVLWLVGASLLGLAMKTTASVAIPLVPLVLLVALWLRRGWRWRTLVLPLAGLLVLGFFIAFSPTGAAAWMRSESATPPRTPFRAALAEAPDGAHAFQLDGASDAPFLRSELLGRHLDGLRRNGLTVGGWLWADRQVEGRAPSLQTSVAGDPYNDALSEPLAIGTQPTFYHQSYEVPETLQRLAFIFWGIQPTDEANRHYLDNAFVVEGIVPEGATVRVEGATVWVGDEARPNLLRNGSAERGGWRVRPELESFVTRYARRSPSAVLATLFDIEQSGPILRERVAPVLVRNLFGGFAWGHVQIAAAWNPLGWLLVAVAFAGMLRWLLAQRRIGAHHLTLLFWLLLLAIGWANALLWPLAYQGARLPSPSARYLHPMLLVMATALAGGWWALWPRRWRGAGLAALFALLLLFNLVAARTVIEHYARVAATAEIQE